MKYYLYNSLSNNGIKPKNIDQKNIIDCVNMDYPKFFDKLEKDDEVVLMGGDGTINYFVNAMRGYKINNNVYLLSNGTGNDFLNDIKGNPNEEVLLNKYIEKLPVAKIKGKEILFVNNMAFGIDGYCCEMADKIKKKKPNKRINYTTIAIRGLLLDFNPCHAEAIVDGKKYEFDDVWMAPTMKGRYFGGGMMIAPGQDRMSDKLTLVIYHAKSRIKSLLRFTTIFTGEHVKYTDMIQIIEGKDIYVKFSRPCPGQADGVTILDVQEYRAHI